MGTFLLSAAKHAMSANRAAEKVAALEGVLTRYYPGWTPYDGNSAIANVETALAYVVSKKMTKAKRKLGQSAATMAFGTAGAVVGGAAGSVALPGAGTALGAVTVGTIIGEAPSVGIQLFRKSKFLYKTIRGTQGVHRKQAATALYNGCKKGSPGETDTYAAAAGALLIIGDEVEFDVIMADPASASAIDAIAKRLKSW
jgi:hypothetical protein